MYLSLKPMTIKKEMVKQMNILNDLAFPYSSKKRAVLNTNSSYDIV